MAREPLKNIGASVRARLLQRSREERTDFQTLLTAEQSLLSASNNRAASKADQALAVVQLYNALGGGWQTMDGSGE